MRKFAAAIGCLAIGAVLSSASAVAAPVGLIEEFDVDGWAYSLTSGPDGDVWFTFDRDPLRVGDAAVGRITSSGKATFFKEGLDRRSALGNMVVGPDGNLWFADQGKRPAVGRITPPGTDHRVQPGSIRKASPATSSPVPTATSGSSTPARRRQSAASPPKASSLSSVPA
jgi:streptogramin lyase